MEPTTSSKPGTSWCMMSSPEGHAIGLCASHDQSRENEMTETLTGIHTTGHSKNATLSF